MSTEHPAENVPCPRCFALAMEGEIRDETVMPLRGGARDALAVDGSGPCCQDCEAADNVQRLHMPGMTWVAARTAVGNDRQEQLRLPGAPMGLVKAGLTKPSKPGDFDRHVAWLNFAVFPHTRGDED